MNKTSLGAGFFYTILAYFIWGILPLYWNLLSAINPLHIAAFRIILSLILISIILFTAKNFAWLRFFKNKREGISLVTAGFLISFNWIIYIWAVNNGQTIEAALGYYINPLISVVLGMWILKEKINFLQIIAFVIAAIGVFLLVFFTGRPPWISLGLAFTFGFYGLIKKTVRFSALESLGIETLAALPLGLLLLAGSFSIGQLSNQQGLAYMMELPWLTLFLLLLCGAVTTLPLYLFGKGVKIIPLSTVGFLQFIAPTLTFLTGIFIFRESFPIYNLVVFGFIWLAMILYIVSLKRYGK
ncbi:MAG: EamA family transporter RarD [Treponema sp.]|nr:EamA family transporter RarD [Treponema sp.]